MGVEREKLGEGGRLIVGRYAVFDEIATGGMATVHIGRLVGPVGFSRTVAIKRLHPQYAKDQDFLVMFMDEARIAARVRHPNVVPTLDIVTENGELFLVMEYVQGDSLSRLVKKSIANRVLPPPPIIAWIVSGILHGLHAAHEAKSEQGEPLNIIHRDVSPQNILVGSDGTPRLLDFGVAKAAERSQTTRAGQVKGKIAYMSPEQLTTDQIDRRTDVYAMGVVMWEALTGLRLFQGANEGRIVHLILSNAVRPPSEFVPALPPIFDEVVLKALAPNPADRYQTAREMALALEASAQLATPSAVGEWVESLASELLHERAGKIAEIESRSDVFSPEPGSQGSGFVMRSQPEIPMPVSSTRSVAPAPVSQPSMSPPTSTPSIVSAPPSSASVPAPVEEPVPFATSQKWKKPAMIAAVVLGFAACVAIFLALTSSVKPQVAPAPPTTVTITVTKTVAATPPPTTTSLSTPLANPTANVVTMPSATVTPIKKQPVNCNPPYSIDKQGIKHPKPECL